MDDKLVALYEEISETAGGTVRCPICNHDEWTFGDDSVYTLTGMSVQRHRRIDAENAGEVEEEAIPDEDFRSAFCITAACRACGFLRLHLIDLREV